MIDDKVEVFVVFFIFFFDEVDCFFVDVCGFLFKFLYSGFDVYGEVFIFIFVKFF